MNTKNKTSKSKSEKNVSEIVASETVSDTVAEIVSETVEVSSESKLDACMRIIETMRDKTLAECARRNAKDNQQRSEFAKYTRAFVERLQTVESIDCEKIFSQYFDDTRSRALAVYALEKVTDTLRAMLYRDISQVSSLHLAYLRAMFRNESIDNKSMHQSIMRDTFKSHSTADTQCSSSMHALRVLDVVEYDSNTKTQKLKNNETVNALRAIFAQ